MRFTHLDTFPQNSRLRPVHEIHQFVTPHKFQSAMTAEQADHDVIQAQLQKIQRINKLLSPETRSRRSINFREALKQLLDQPRPTLINKHVPRSILVYDVRNLDRDRGGDKPQPNRLVRFTGGPEATDPTNELMYQIAETTMARLNDITRALSPEKPERHAFSRAGTLTMIHGFDDEPNDDASYINAGYGGLNESDDIIVTGYIKEKDRDYVSDPAGDVHVLAHEVGHGGDVNISPNHVHGAESGAIGEGFGDLTGLWINQKLTGKLDTRIGSVFASGRKTPDSALREMDGTKGTPAHTNHPIFGDDLQRLDWYNTPPSEWGGRFFFEAAMDRFVHIGNINYNTRSVKMVELGLSIDNVMMVSALSLTMMRDVAEVMDAALYRSYPLTAYYDVLAAEKLFGKDGGTLLRSAWKLALGIDIPADVVGSISRELGRIYPKDAVPARETIERVASARFKAIDLSALALAGIRLGN